MIRTIEWTESGVVMLDQRVLPGEETYLTFTDYRDVAEAIRTLVIRGAPAIGVAAAMGAALGVKNSRARTVEELEAEFKTICGTITATRPTAVNLFWAVERMQSLYEKTKSRGLEAVRRALVEEAQAMHREDVEANKAMGRFGQALFPDEGCILTHCNAGALATAGYGTALGVIRAAVEAGKKIRVFADETRPFLQGARLTAWELAHDRIPLTVITDNMAGYFMKKGEIDGVIVGADRIAANGDVANKIGTYSVAVLAREHGIPFWVAAPLSTVDRAMPSGDGIEIEQRSPEEVRRIGNTLIVPENVPVAHPAFDVTPARYVHAIITDYGIALPPYTESIQELFQKAGL
ncbi:MAG: S-methyl-5-thioribose-1-phosphate isomerase [Acidobacteria bacterium]|nr:S-methyl-5-thioribose-1-phosphate isomerase [Acidobacteriota bacterium]